MRTKNTWIWQPGGNKGSILISFSALLLLCMSLVLFYSFISRWIRFEQDIYKACYTEQTNTFSQNKRRLQQLLKLNPKAFSLRVENTQLQAELLLALAQRNLVLAAKVKLKIAKNFQKRKQLDRLQKNYIQLANTQFERSNLRLKKKISSILSSEARRNAIHQIDFDSVTFKSTRLSVVADSPDPAPIYELESPFELKQSWSVNWKTELDLKIEFLNFPKWQAQKICSTTLKKADYGKFEIIPADKYL
jgi:hypothetical protein